MIFTNFMFAMMAGSVTFALSSHIFLGKGVVYA